MDEKSGVIFRNTATFRAKFSSLKEIGQFVRKAIRKAQLSEGTTYKVLLAVDEACSNIIEHAYGGESDEDINCSCVVTEKDLVIQLRDHGGSFNPDTVPSPDLKSTIEHRARGGLGVFFIRQFMDEVIYKSVPAKPQSGQKYNRENILILVKRKEGEDR